ncbi:MAG: hypothetical protein PHR83_03865 [Paludibacter sp.]|nr:hypothetical protein [Paludibacter sp.]
MKRLTIIILIIFFGVRLSAVSPYKNNDYLQRSKQVIISYTDSTFFNKLYPSEIKQTTIANCYFLNKDTIAKYHEQDSVFVLKYLIVTDYYKQYCYRAYGGFCSEETSSSILLSYDRNMRLIYKPDLSRIFKGYNIFLLSPQIERKKIKQLSDSLSENEKMKIRSILWIYDFKKEQLLWEIEREKGFRSGYTETQQIDISTKSLISKDGVKFQRSFGKALIESYYKLFE